MSWKKTTKTRNKNQNPRQDLKGLAMVTFLYLPKNHEKKTSCFPYKYMSKCWSKILFVVEIVTRNDTGQKSIKKNLQVRYSSMIVPKDHEKAILQLRRKEGKLVNKKHKANKTKNCKSGLFQTSHYTWVECI